MGLTCSEIVDQILKGGVEREKAVRHVHQTYFGYVYKMNDRFKLSLDEVIDAYVDAVVLFEQKVTTGSFKVERPKACSTFIFQTLEYKCLNQSRKTPFLYEEIDAFYDLEDAVKSVDERLSIEDLWKVVGDLSEKCQNILSDWVKGYKMAEIAERVGLKNAESVAVSKGRCVNKLIELLKGKGWM